MLHLSKTRLAETNYRAIEIELKERNRQIANRRKARLDRESYQEEEDELTREKCCGTFGILCVGCVAASGDELYADFAVCQEMCRMEVKSFFFPARKCRFLRWPQYPVTPRGAICSTVHPFHYILEAQS